MEILALTRRKSSLKQDYKIRASNDNKKNNRFTIFSIIILMIIAIASINNKSFFNQPSDLPAGVDNQLNNNNLSHYKHYLLILFLKNFQILICPSSFLKKNMRKLSSQ
jgi:uncharacterized membrane protein